MLKHTELINTLIGCVGGLGLIAGLLRYVDNWREQRKEKPIEFSAFEAIWEALSGGVTAIGVFWILEGYGVNELAAVGISFMAAYLGVRIIAYYVKKFLDSKLRADKP